MEFWRPTVNACAISPDGSLIVSASDDDKTLKLWDARTGHERATLRGDVQACAVSPDGSTIVSAGRDDEPARRDLCRNS